MREVRVRKETQEWMDQEVLEGIRILDRLLKKFRSSKTHLKLQVIEVSLIFTGWRRTEDYGEPRRFINMNFPLDGDDENSR